MIPNDLQLQFTSALLCRDVNKVHDEWFSDMDAVRLAVGLVDDAPAAGPSGSNSGKVVGPIFTQTFC